MATGIDSIGINGMRKAHFTQLMDYIEERDKTEWHVGNKEQFDQRHKDILEWMGNFVYYLRHNDVKISK